MFELELQMRESLEQRLEEVFSDLEPVVAAMIKSLYFEAFDEVSQEMLTTFSALSETVLFQLIWMHLCSEVYQSFKRLSTRDHDGLVAQLKRAVSLNHYEDQVIARMTLNQGLGMLYRYRPSALKVVLDKFEGFTLQEIAARKGMSLQQVRTEMDKGLSFLRSNLSPRAVSP